MFDKRLVLVLSILCTASLACSLGGSVPPTAVPTADISPAATNPTLVPSATAQTSIVPSLASGNPTSASDAQVCSPHTDWLTYQVQAGDTLTAIAQRTYTTLADLASANCFSQTTKVAIGQAIYVPRAPLSSVPVAQSGGPSIGTLTIQPSNASKDGTTAREVLAGSSVSLQVNGVQNSNLVTFYGDVPGNPEYVMGTAGPVSGIATLAWQIPQTLGPELLLRAEAMGTGGQTASTLFVRVLIGTGGASSTSMVGCPSAPPPRLAIGDTGRVTPGLPNTLRSLPGKSVSGSVMTGQIPAGGTFTVLAGPQCADAYVWWQVNYNGKIGWTPEGENTTYWLEPVATTATADGCPTALPPRLVIGGQARVTPGQPNLIRTLPSKSTGSVVGQIPAGGVFNVIGGPQCGDGLRFWQVTYNGQTGWTAEGQGTSYWLEPLS